MAKKSKTESKRIWVILGVAVAIIVTLGIVSMFSPTVKKALFGEAISKGTLLESQLNLNLKEGTVFSGPRGEGDYIIFFEGNSAQIQTGNITICSCDTSCPTFSGCQELLDYQGISTTSKVGGSVVADDGNCFFVELYSLRGAVNIYECSGSTDIYSAKVSTSSESKIIQQVEKTQPRQAVSTTTVSSATTQCSNMCQDIYDYCSQKCSS